MDSDPWVIPLTEAALCDDQRIGGKAAQLARLHRVGFRIAPGFCVTVAAYDVKSSLFGRAAARAASKPNRCCSSRTWNPCSLWSIR